MECLILQCIGVEKSHCTVNCEVYVEHKFIDRPHLPSTWF